MILIKKYGNRRLYDTEASRYITLEELAARVRGGADVSIVDAQSGEDLTQPTLAQIIMESRGGARMLPARLLHELIRLGDDGLTDFSSFGFEAETEDRDPFAEVAANDLGVEPAPFLGGGNDAAEVARQLSNLSPAAARAVAAAAKATTDEEREAALAAVSQEGEEPIDRELLLRFLASVKS